MDKSILIQMVNPDSGKVEEKVKIEFEEDAITSTRHGGMKARLEKPEPGNTYTLNASINLGPVMGIATHSRTLRMPAKKDDD